MHLNVLSISSRCSLD